MEPNAALSVFTSSAIVVWLIQQVKASKYFPWITAETTKINRVASAILAMLTSAGLGWAWTPATHTLVISNLTWAVVGLAVWHSIQHFCLQEAIYRATERKSSIIAPQASSVNVSGPVTLSPAKQ